MIRQLAYWILDRLFVHEVINGRGRVAEYLHRWVLWTGRDGRAVYVHHFVGSDWSRDVHDHPKAFTSIGLWGRYAEVTIGRAPVVYRAPWFRRFPAEHIHRLVLAPGETCWTLVCVGPLVREWGFWRVVERDSRIHYATREWVKWDEYVYGTEADERVAGTFSNRAALRELDVWTGWD